MKNKKESKTEEELDDLHKEELDKENLKKVEESDSLSEDREEDIHLTK